MVDQTNLERIVILETELDNVKKMVGEVLLEQKKTNELLIRYKGFFGGVAFVLSGFVTILIFFKEWLFKKVGI